MEDEGLDSDADMADSDLEDDSDDADEDLAMEMEDGRPKADEMGVEHLATLERLRQNQRQDYLKVGPFSEKNIRRLSSGTPKLSFFVRKVKIVIEIRFVIFVTF